MHSGPAAVPALLCAGTAYVGRWSAGQGHVRARAQPGSLGSRAGRLGEEAGRCRDRGGTVATAPFLGLAVLARSCGGGAQGQGRHSHPGPAPAHQPGSALEGGGSSPGVAAVLPSPLLGFLASPFPSTSAIAGPPEVPGDRILRWGKLSIFTKACPWFPIDVQGGL